MQIDCCKLLQEIVQHSVSFSSYCSQTIILDRGHPEFLLKVNATWRLMHPYNSNIFWYAKRLNEKETNKLQIQFCKKAPKKDSGRLWHSLTLNHAFVCHFGLKQQEPQSTQETPPFWIRRRSCNHKATSDWARMIIWLYYQLSYQNTQQENLDTGMTHTALYWLDQVSCNWFVL